MTVSIKFPFAIEGGSVVTTNSEPEAITSRVVFCLSTQLGERVTRPEWGVEILNASYAMTGDLIEGLREGIENAFHKWFPTYELRAVDIKWEPGKSTIVNVSVRYGKFDTALDEMAKVGVRMPDGTEIYQAGER
jgi:phage baseplate assembly protein W